MEILWNLLDDHFLVVYQIKARREILDEIYSGRIFDLFYELARGVVNRNRKFFLYKDFERSVTAYGDKIGARDFGGDFVIPDVPSCAMARSPRLPYSLTAFTEKHFAS